jgi:hypothetical protein
LKVLIIFAMAMLAGCAAAIRPQAADTQASALFDDIRHHDNDAAVLRFDPRLATPDLPAQLASIQRLLPAEEPSDRRQISTNIMTSAGNNIISVADEYDFPGRVALVQTRLFRPANGDTWLVQGFHVQVATSAELAVNDFTLLGKPVGRYAFLLLMLAVPAIMLAAVVKIYRTPELMHKWLWALGCVVGLGSVSVNWANGAVQYNLVSLQFLGVGFSRANSRFAPWMLAISLPVLALLVLARVVAHPAPYVESEE